jgi:hypothetical protein
LKENVVVSNEIYEDVIAATNGYFFMYSNFSITEAREGGRDEWVKIAVTLHARPREVLDLNLG